MTGEHACLDGTGGTIKEGFLQVPPRETGDSDGESTIARKTWYSGTPKSGPVRKPTGMGEKELQKKGGTLFALSSWNF